MYGTKLKGVKEVSSLCGNLTFANLDDCNFNAF
jgi:hypothetical protein